MSAIVAFGVPHTAALTTSFVVGPLSLDDGSAAGRAEPVGWSSERIENGAKGAGRADELAQTIS